MTASNEDEAILERLKLISVPAKTYYLVLADEHSDMAVIMRKILTGAAIVAIQVALAAWFFANEAHTAGWAMAAIGALGLISASRGVALLWRRGKHLREAREARETLEGKQGWLWRQEGRILSGINDDEPEYVVESALRTCKEAKDRMPVEDVDGLAEYWHWVACVHDHALVSLGQSPILGTAHGRVGDEYEKSKKNREPA